MRWVLQGYYGLGNLGDDLMLHLLLDELHSLDPEGSFTVLLADGGDPSRVDLPAGVPVRLLESPGTLGTLRVLGEADVLIYGGGTCLHGRGACGLKRNLWARLLGLQVYWLGVGADPLPPGRARRLGKVSLATCRGAVFRDAGSARIAGQLVPWHDRLAVSVDLVYLLARDHPELLPVREGAGPSSPRRRSLVVSWRHLHPESTSGTPEAALRVVAGELVAFADRHGIPRISVVSLADLIDGEANRALESALREAIRAASSPCRLKSYLSLSMREKVRHLSQAELVFCVRLHGILVSKLLGRPAVGVGYARKVYAFADHLTQPCVVDLARITESPSELRTILESEYRSPAAFVEGVESLAAQAGTTIDKLREWTAGLV